MYKVKDLLKNLTKLVEECPECAEYPIIYSHDDEGNQYQKVSFQPALCQIEFDKKAGPYVELVEFYIEGRSKITLKECNAVIIN
jgi:hypothetical protein